jgi:adenylate cyclase
MLLYELQLFQPLERKSWDLRLRLFSKPSHADKNIVLFLIDQYSLDFYEEQQGLSWPWPREMYSYLADYLETGGARLVFFDFIFSESSVYGVEDDLRFASSIKKAGNVFLPVFLSREDKGPEESNTELLRPFSVDVSGNQAVPVFLTKSVTLPVSELLSVAKGVGNVQFQPDEDSIYRRIPLLFSYNKMVLPALPLAMAEFIGENRIEVRRSGSIWFDKRKIPLDDSGRMVIKYNGPQGTYTTYSVASIINSWAQINEGTEPQVPPGMFSGKIVLVSSSAPGIFDLRATPFSAVCPGVEIQAAVLDNILNQDFISFPGDSVVLCLILLSALVTGVGTSVLQRSWVIGLFFILCLIIPAALSSFFFFSGCWLEFAAPEFAVVTAFISAALLNYSLEGKKRRFIKNVFRFYLSPSLIDMIVKDPKLLNLGGDKREITSFFSDIQGFTSVSESLSPEELVDLLNHYLSEMSGIIINYSGTLDKYEGDAIIAFWNAPLEQEGHAVKACKAALDCQNRLKDMGSLFKSKYGHVLSARIGINTGPAVVGNMGSQRRFDYTAIGDTVNLASRLEGACKQYRVPILIGQDTCSEVKDHILTREVDIIRVVGKSRPVKVFEIIAEKEEATGDQQKLVSDFQEALEGYKSREWEKAAALFQSIKEDALAGLYAARCTEFVKNPPPEDWDGVFGLKIK